MNSIIKTLFFFTLLLILGCAESLNTEGLINIVANYQISSEYSDIVTEMEHRIEYENGVKVRDEIKRNSSLGSINTKNTFDTNNNVIKSTTIKDGSIVSETTKSFTSNNLLLDWIYVTYKGQIWDTVYHRRNQYLDTTANPVVYKSIILAHGTTAEFNCELNEIQNNRTERCLRKSTQREIGFGEYQYLDNNKRIIEKQEYSTEVSELDTTKIDTNFIVPFFYEYDNLGNVIKETIGGKDSGTQYKIYKYSKQGLLKKEIQVSSIGERKIINYKVEKRNYDH
ncbi:MAG: hypothetical protein IPM42_21145 [Saprospiraceae bacterium]|nr:hypothetical protein [Saprospiraceae bacterium]